MRVHLEHGRQYDTRQEAEEGLKHALSIGRVSKAERPRVGVTRWYTMTGPHKAYVITVEKPEP
jgi:hypothetical protein